MEKDREIAIAAGLMAAGLITAAMLLKKEEDKICPPDAGLIYDPVEGVCRCENPEHAFDGSICRSPECDDANPCPEGFECVEGFCQPIETECTFNEDCRFDEMCVEGKCVPKTLPVECSINEDCPPFHICVNGVCVLNITSVAAEVRVLDPSGNIVEGAIVFLGDPLDNNSKITGPNGRAVWSGLPLDTDITFLAASTWRTFSEPVTVNTGHDQPAIIVDITVPLALGDEGLCTSDTALNIGDPRPCIWGCGEEPVGTPDTSDYVRLRLSGIPSAYVCSYYNNSLHIIEEVLVPYTATDWPQRRVDDGIFTEAQRDCVLNWLAYIPSYDPYAPPPPTLVNVIVTVRDSAGQLIEGALVLYSIRGVGYTAPNTDASGTTTFKAALDELTELDVYWAQTLKEQTFTPTSDPFNIAVTLDVDPCAVPTNFINFRWDVENSAWLVDFYHQIEKSAYTGLAGDGRGIYSYILDSLVSSGWINEAQRTCGTPLAEAIGYIVCDEKAVNVKYCEEGRIKQEWQNIDCTRSTRDLGPCCEPGTTGTFCDPADNIIKQIVTNELCEESVLITGPCGVYTEGDKFCIDGRVIRQDWDELGQMVEVDLGPCCDGDWITPQVCNEGTGMLESVWQKENCETEIRERGECCVEGEPAGEPYCVGPDRWQRYRNRDCTLYAEILEVDGCLDACSDINSNEYIIVGYYRAQGTWDTSYWILSYYSQRDNRLEEFRSSALSAIVDQIAIISDPRNLHLSLIQQECARRQVAEWEANPPDPTCIPGPIGEPYCRELDLIQPMQDFDCNTYDDITANAPVCAPPPECSEDPTSTQFMKIIQWDTGDYKISYYDHEYGGIRYDTKPAVTYLYDILNTAIAYGRITQVQYDCAELQISAGFTPLCSDSAADNYAQPAPCTYPGAECLDTSSTDYIELLPGNDGRPYVIIRHYSHAILTGVVDSSPLRDWAEVESRIVNRESLGMLTSTQVACAAEQQAAMGVFGSW